MIRALLCVGTASLSLLVAPAAQADIELGAKKYTAGDYKGAIVEWLPYAAQGEPNALFNLGQVYRLGKGAPADLRRAAGYYEQAARLGHKGAQANLGTLLFFNDGPLRDVPTGIQWWKVAAASGEPRALHMLGVLYYNGELLVKDVPRAYAYVSIAAAQNVDGAREALALMEPVLTPRDRAAAEPIRQKVEAAMRGEVANPEPFPGASLIQTAAGAPAATSSSADHKTTVASLSPASKPAVQAPMTVALSAPAPSPRVPQTTADVATVATPGWRVQIGAYSTQAAAKDAWSDIRSARHALLPANVGPVYQDAGAVTRLQLAGFAEKMDAGKACAALKSAGRDCFVIKAN